MTKQFNLPRGTADIFPDDATRWQDIEAKARNLFALYGFREIRTPLFEETELFARSMGQTSDVVQKQMLNLAAQGEGGESSGFSLRPEGTASVVRAYVQNSLDKKESRSKFFYVGPMFRGERPQKGRLRQFHQIGAEVIGPGTTSPFLDAEMIELAVHLLTKSGVKALTVKINSLGTPEDKKNFSAVLRQALEPYTKELCADCQSRLSRNVFRVLDCKKKTCQAVVDRLPLKYDHLSPESRDYFDKVKEALRMREVAFVEEPRLVRGLDYYTHTVFEISSSSLGSQDALGAGGRYNNLVQELGGHEVDAVGFALGIERIILATEGETGKEPVGLDAFIVPLGEAAMKEAFGLLPTLRNAGIAVDISYRWDASLKSQMRQADKTGAKAVLILGENELAMKSVAVKDMASGDQEVIPFAQLVGYLTKK